MSASLAWLPGGSRGSVEESCPHCSDEESTVGGEGGRGGEREGGREGGREEGRKGGRKGGREGGREGGGVSTTSSRNFASRRPTETKFGTPRKILATISITRLKRIAGYRTCSCQFTLNCANCVIERAISGDIVA